MLEGLLYLVTSFWLGAVHAATPGHGKTIAASYIIGVRGRPVDALVLGIFVTLSHTSGIVLVAVLATLGSAWLVPQRVEAYLALATGILVIGMGGWMLRTQIRPAGAGGRRPPARGDPTPPRSHTTTRGGPRTTACRSPEPGARSTPRLRTGTARTTTATAGGASTRTTSRRSPIRDRASPCCSASASPVGSCRTRRPRHPARRRSRAAR